MNKILIIITLISAQLVSKDLINILETELNRSFEGLKNEETPPYYIGYAVTETEEIRITSSFGHIVSDLENRSRILDIDLRVGERQLDNTHIIRGESFSFASGSSSPELSIENEEMAIRQAIWKATDSHYKNAIETLDKVLTNKKVKIKEEDNSPDFSVDEVYTENLGKAPKINVDKTKWTAELNKLSSMFLAEPWLYTGTVSFNVEHITKYFVDTEGRKLVWPETYARISVYAKTKADDGMSLPLYKTFFSYEDKNLANSDEITKDIEELIATLNLLKTADIMGTYSGPAILSGEAAGVFFHEIFGHRVEGHREKDPNSSQTFKKSMGKEILPDFINVIFDPTKRSLKGNEISGNYPFDDQGIKAEKVIAVEDGKFKNFLMSRSPIDNFPKSNGHGRRQPGRDAVSRQSNLIVDAKTTVSIIELKDKLRELCKKEDKEFGLFFDVVQGGFTFTNRTIPNAFNVLPLVVYKIFTDGRPDELVRGVDLIGTPLTTFSNIVAAANDIGVFNGICGAESGSVPVSACSPTLLVSNIEVQKKQKSQAKLPVLESPIKQTP
ncbi:metallopeptidase TldD-related protein [Candidatus Kapabacteria bacterium]|nr:metallopeptidase TldD-related protein [Candidatus Kapabacteria bacterium]